MRLVLLFLAVVVSVCPAALAQSGADGGGQPKVRNISMPADSTAGSISGNLSEGKKLSSLRWAENSAVACFPGTRFEQFNGSHVFYRIMLPPASAMKITLEPKDGKNINLYALRQIAQGVPPVPPDIDKAVSCEASYPTYANLPGGKRVENEITSRSVEYISVGSQYTILIGVAGAEGLTEGDYDLVIEIKPR